MTTIPTPATLFPVQRDDRSAPFFDAAAEDRLLIRRSTGTGELLAPDAQVDSAGGTALDWVDAAGTGRVESWAVIHRKPDDAGRTHPVVVAIVALTEGPWMRTQLVGARPEQVHHGAPVRAVFVRPDGGEAMPVFVLAEEPA